MKTTIIILASLLSLTFIPERAFAQENKLVKISQDLLKTVKAKKSTATLESTIKNLDKKRLFKELNTDNEKIAFWVNIYNAFIQIKLNANPSLYEKRGKFFSMKQVDIAGELLSFEQIEHGFIRRSQKPAGLGYVKKLFPNRLERKLRVKEINYRVHFALNCGAKSCPPVGIYSAKNLDQELAYMTKNYLKKNTSYDEKSNTAESTTLFSWFRGDFGGLSGVKEILKEQQLIPNTDVDLKFKDYDWTLLTNQFVDIKV